MPLDINQIKQCISEWGKLVREKSKSSTIIDRLISNKASFTFNVYFTKKSTYIHAYPGVFEGKLIIFLIAAEFDKYIYRNTLEKYISIAYPEDLKLNLQDEIDKKEALIRISNWKKQVKTWIPKQASSETGFFKCYLIPANDLKSKQSIAYFALKSVDTVTQYDADLIITNEANVDVTNAEAYYDTVRLVPPYRPEEEMYLLTDSDNGLV